MISPLTLDELRTLWPDDASGERCAVLLQRYLHSRLIDSMMGAECVEERAQAEAAAGKAIAKMARDFEKLLTGPEKEITGGRLTHLRRRSQNGGNSQTNTNENSP